MNVQLDETEIVMIIVVFLTAALAVALAAVLMVVAICIRAEDRRGLTSQAPSRMTGAVPRLCGLRVGPQRQMCLAAQPAAARRPA